MLRWRQLRTVEVLTGRVVVEPVLVRLEAPDNRVPLGRGVVAGMLRRRGVAAADVAAMGAAAEVEPPALGRKALHAARPAREDRRVDLVLSRHPWSSRPSPAHRDPRLPAWRRRRTCSRGSS